MAIGAVRPLCINGIAQPLPPRRGNTGLRCARTSFGWSADSARWYLLIMQDLDGENASLRQKRRNPATQTGGMSLPQLQAFWLQHHVPNAVILDGGDSTQYADDSGCLLPSGYLGSRTLGYLHRRPLRCFPPLQDHIGVMNYLYVLEK